MKKYVIEQLKENIPLTKIKKDLIDKGYDVEDINKAVREAIAGIDKKLSNTTIIQIGILVVGVVIAIGIAMYLTGNRYATETNEKREQTNLLYREFCQNYPKVQNEVSCESAISSALKQYPGEVISINKTQIPMRDRDTEKLLVQNFWLIEINFDTPLQLPTGTVSATKGQITVDVNTGAVNLHKIV